MVANGFAVLRSSRASSTSDSPSPQRQPRPCPIVFSNWLRLDGKREIHCRLLNMEREARVPQRDIELQLACKTSLRVLNAANDFKRRSRRLRFRRGSTLSRDPDLDIN